MRIVVASVVVWLVAVAVVSGREWTDVTGKFHAEAKLLGREGHRIWLEKSNGQTITVAINRLSMPDREFVEHKFAADPVTLVVPEPPTATETQVSTTPGRPSFYLTAQATQTEQADVEVEEENGWRLKYVYRGCDLDAHLIIGKGPPRGIGTVTSGELQSQVLSNCRPRVGFQAM